MRLSDNNEGEKGSGMNEAFTKFKVVNIYIGLILVLGMLLPVGLLINATFGGMYGPMFRNFNPAVFHLVILSCSYIIAGIIVHITIKKMDLLERLHVYYASTSLFAIGNAIIILFLIIRVFASTIPGGGACVCCFNVWSIPTRLSQDSSLYRNSQSSCWHRATPCREEPREHCT
ncbi:hypothetical protein ACFL3K_02195 [Pseudomonadota bacterium]